MKDLQQYSSSVGRKSILCPSRPLLTQIGRVFVAAFGLFTVIVAGPQSAWAQDNQILAQPTRLTVQDGASGTITNLMIRLINGSTNNAATYSLSVDFSGATGVTGASLDTYSISLPVAPSGNQQTVSNTALTVTYNGTVPQSGVNRILVSVTNTSASDDWDYVLPVPINSAVVWNGNTNANAWSGHWLPGNPTGGDIALFSSAGASPLATDPDWTTNALTNVVMSSDQFVGGLRFSHGDQDDGLSGVPEPDGVPDPDGRYRVEIKPGTTLSVTGAAGFYMLQDTVDRNGAMRVELFGGGNLVVSNENANVATLKEWQQDVVLDMDGLDTFIADVDRVGFGNFLLYPDYRTNGWILRGGASSTNARPGRFVNNVSLAKTNVIRASFPFDPGILTNAEVRQYAFTFAQNENQGSGVDMSMQFGISNAFFADSILFIGQGAQAELPGNSIRFNTDTNVIPTNVVPVAYFRGLTTERVPVFSICDAASQGNTGGGTKGALDLRGGIVDAKVDRFYVGRDALEGDGASAQGQFFFDGGLVDVNTLLIGAQELGNNQNTNAGTQAVYSRGVVNVGSNAVLVVHGTIHLGWTTADSSDNRFVVGPTDNRGGRINVTDGGTLMVDNILVGGVGTNAFGFAATHVPQENNITISDGGTLIVTNGVGDTTQGLRTFDMSDSTLGLFVDGNKSDAYVYTDELLTGGSSNTLDLIAVTNVGSFPATLKLIKYNSASPNFGVKLPAGTYGYLVNNTLGKSIDVVLLDTEPQNRRWRGTPGTIWNTVSANWQGDETFANGDSATFDDSASNFGVSVTNDLYVGGFGVVLSNDTHAYTFSGPGYIRGTAPMNKWGANSMTMNANSELALTIREGSVTGNGSLGSTTVKSNASLTFDGDLNGLTTAGTTLLTGSATVSNLVTVQTGTLTNAGNINCPVVAQGDAIVTITSGGKVNMNAPGTASVGPDALLVLNGKWNTTPVSGANGTYLLEISGTMEGPGWINAITQDKGLEPPGRASRVNIAAGGVFSPGASNGVIMIHTNLGRFDFQVGGRVIMDVNMDSVEGSNPFSGDYNYENGNIWTNAKYSDVLFLGRWSTMRGALVLNNIGSTPFTNGTVFKLFKKPDDEFWKDPFHGEEYGNIPLNEDHMPTVQPALPGLGLQWDLSNFRTNGVVRVVSGGPTTPPTLDYLLSAGTLQFSWPSNYLGWEMFVQTNELGVGLTTDWTPIPSTVSVTNYEAEIAETNPAVFYKLDLPVVAP